MSEVCYRAATLVTEPRPYRAATVRERLRLRGRWRCRLLRRLVSRLPAHFHGTDQNMRVAAFQPGLAFHRAVWSQVRSEPHEQLLAEIGVRDFAPAELHHRLHPITLGEEAYRVLHLEVVIVIVGVG